MSTTYDPDYLPADRKICVPLAFAPVENNDGRFIAHNKIVVHTPQAARCPRCKALLAVGDSYHHHVYFCARSSGVQP